MSSIRSCTNTLGQYMYTDKYVRVLSYLVFQMIRGDYIGHIVKYYTVAICVCVRFSEYVNRNILYTCMYCNDVFLYR